MRLPTAPPKTSPIATVSTRPPSASTRTATRARMRSATIDSRATSHRHAVGRPPSKPKARPGFITRSEEHTSELQSPCNLVCRLLLEKKKKTAADQRHTRASLTLAVSHQLRIITPATNTPSEFRDVS